MKINGFAAFEGKNIYSLKKCIRMDVDLEGYCEIPSNKIDGFNDRLVKMIPELKKHRCGIDEEGGFVKRLHEGTYLAHITEHIIIAIQNKLGMDVSYGKAREIQGDLYYIIYQYEYKNTAIEIGKTACDIINCLICKSDFKFSKRLKEIKRVLLNEQLGPSTLSICYEARRRNIPVMKINDGSMFQIGYGKYSKIIEATISSNTSSIAVDISCDKLMTKEILNNQCIPIARGGIVNNKFDLLFKANYIGYPIVLKPRYGNQGKGVFVNIESDKEAIKIYEQLSRKYGQIIIERYISGRDYRVCVIGDKVSAVAERVSPFVIGDGNKTIRQLINSINSDPDRGEGHEKPLTKIRIDNELIQYIQKKGYSLNYILPEGEKIVLRENANLSTGGIAIDRTEEICNENIELCIRVAKTIGLDICGIDICTSDISIPLSKEGAVIEVNAAPGIRMHHYPCEGKSRNVAGDIIDMLFKDTPQNIPIVSVTGTNGKTTTTRLIGHVMGMAGYNVGMTTTGGIYINNRCIEKGDTTGPDSAITVLTNREIDAAVLETARGGMVRRGLAYDFSDVGIITNITEDHIGIDGINSLEELAFVKSLVVEAVKKDGYAVINADDPMSLTILDRIKSNIVFFSKDKQNKYLVENIKRGGYGIYLDGDNLYLAKGTRKELLIDVKDICITLNGKLKFNIENAMAACAALTALKIDSTIIRSGLKSFFADENQNPGRFNIFKLGDISVILDYGHNVEGYKAVLEGVSSLKPKRLVGIIGVPGDRKDSNIIEVGKVAGSFFNYIYIKEDLDKRGRAPFEVAKLLEEGVNISKNKKLKYEIVLDEKDALNIAIENSSPGDVIIIFFEKYEPLLELIKEKQKSNSDKKIAISNM